MTSAAGTLDMGMSSGHTVTTAPANVHVEVRLGAELLASSDRAVRPWAT